jgi:hypothetical protein
MRVDGGIQYGYAHGAAYAPYLNKTSGKNGTFVFLDATQASTLLILR